MTRLKDIADVIGVSISTVSRAISNDTSRPVSEETKRKIREAALKLGYPLDDTPAAAASRTQIACVIPGKLLGNHPYFSEVLQGFHGKMAEMGQPAAIVRTFEEVNDAERFQAMLTESGARGVLALGWYDKELHELLDKQGIPILGVSLNDDSLKMPIVDCDRVSAARMAVAHLLDQGHTKIGYVGGPAFFRKLENDERFIGFQFAMLQGNLPIRREWVVNTNWDVDLSYRLVTGMLQELPRADWPTAMFCASDMLAIPAMRAALEQQCRIPEDIAFVGMDNIGFSQYTSPPLTSIDVPRQEIGKLAAKFLCDYVEEDYRIPPRILLPCSLIVRESSVHDIRP
ncbi:LacI family transcriptional regulator [Paenibacillus chitinolyticus]|uniref:LacI family DNA-binding transcriptional regulator n=1 Tax=Paenibacillus chitinolyticus TaxID=79263 RepID=UPI0026E4AB7D|nr:LacI family DNA-binding transcriptional regulator [Paenibacillus chitinolyticus]GKS09545.1 LacI family transcriptional regulator [Paenibacillus chitinolyticus]